MGINMRTGMQTGGVDRRTALAAGIAGLALLPAGFAKVPPKSPPFHIAACDWMLLKRQKPSALELGKECGLDGVEVDMGKLGDRPDLDNRLRDETERKQYLELSRKHGVEICSLALSAFYGHSFAEHPKAEAMLAEWIELLKKMDVRFGFLPMGERCDAAKHPKVREKAIALFRQAAPAAEKAGVALGLETDLDAEGHRRLLDSIGSKAFVACYNLGDHREKDRDLAEELKALGKDRIGHIHCKEGSVRLGDGKIDFPKVREALDAIGWRGWLVIERSRQPNKSVVENFSANAAYLRKVFGS